MNDLSFRPPMCKSGKIIFLTIAYPPNPTASSVVHRQLLEQFDPASFVVITGFFPGARKVEVPAEVKQHFIYVSFEFISSKIHKLMAGIQRVTIPLFLRFYFWKIKPVKVIIAYPDLYWFDLCISAAIKHKIPFIPYLHDTILEAATSEPVKKRAQTLQQRAFTNAEKIAVMSEGMKELYLEKYNIETVAWEHIYPEIPDTIIRNKELRAHWSGDVYEVNYRSVFRLNRAIEKLGLQFSISNGKTREQLNAYGISGSHIQKVFYPDRANYLKQLGTAKFLFLGLNYPDECNIHEDELATIFSTKTPEYLGSGSLIVYHGPAHYFLARFILEHNCGVVIDTRNEHELIERLSELNNNYQAYIPCIENAKNSMQIFKPENVLKKVENTLNG